MVESFAALLSLQLMDLEIISDQRSTVASAEEMVDRIRRSLLFI